MASGAVVVASPVGENSFLIDHKKTGILVSTPHEWVAYLHELIKDPTLRGELGGAARKHIQEHYSFESRRADIAVIVDSLTYR